MNMICQALEENETTETPNEESNDTNGDKINFEQFTIDEYNPKLRPDDDYLTDIMNDYSLT